MASSGDRNLGFVFGALGAIVLVVVGLVDFFGRFLLLALGLGSTAFVV